MSQTVYPLSAYGDVTTLAGARDAFALALEVVRKLGGGIIEIPACTHPDFTAWQSHEHIAIVDTRTDRLGLQPPVRGAFGSAMEGYSEGGLLVRRTRQEPSPLTGRYAAQSVFQRNIHGGGSFSTALLYPVKQGSASRWYPTSIEGIFKGQHFEIYSPRLPYDLTVTAIGWESQSEVVPTPAPYFVADAPKELPAGSIILSKQDLGTLSVDSHDHCANQSAALRVEKHVYSQGDTLGSEVRLFYQGNVISGQGDEGGHGYSAQIIQDPVIFHGEVDKFEITTDPETGCPVGELTYLTPAAHPEHLGTCRPIINMNRKRQKTTGAVRVWGPGGDYFKGAYPESQVVVQHGVVHGVVQGVGTDWTPEVVGQYLALDVPTEYLDPNEPQGFQFFTPERRIYRWFRIVDFKVDPNPGNPDPQLLWVYWVGSGDAEMLGAPPVLYPGNYTEHLTQAPLPYIIAPGAIVSDVSGGVPETDATTHTIYLQPNADFDVSEPPLFAQGDDIEQAIGPFAWNPSGYRVVHGNNFVTPKGLGEYSFYARNLGTAAVEYGLALTGNAQTVDAAKRAYPRGQLAYRTGISFDAVLGKGIVFNADIPPDANDNFLGVWPTDAGSAIVFEQATGNRKVIAWSTQNTRAYATIGFDPETHAFLVRVGSKTGPGKVEPSVNIGGAALAGLRGISALADGPKANNLRGINVSVPPGERELEVRFKENGQDNPENDDQYGIQITPSWPTVVSVTEKTSQSFRVHFETAAPTNDCRIDWFLVR